METNMYSDELQLWSCVRVAQELTRKIDHLKKRQVEVGGDNGHSRMLTQGAYVSLRAIFSAIEGDITQYTERRRAAWWFYSRLDEMMGYRTKIDLNVKIMSDAFDICLSQRLAKYIILLGWEERKVLDCVAVLRRKIRHEGVEVNGNFYRLICTQGMSVSQMRLIAVHGGSPCQLDYRKIYNEVVLKREYS